VTDGGRASRLPARGSSRTVACDSGSNIASTANSAGTAAEFADSVLPDHRAMLRRRRALDQRQPVSRPDRRHGRSPVGRAQRAVQSGSGTGLPKRDAGSVQEQRLLQRLRRLSAAVQLRLRGEAVAPGESCTSNPDCALAAGGSALCFMQASEGSFTGTCFADADGRGAPGTVRLLVRGLQAAAPQWLGMHRPIDVPVLLLRQRQVRERQHRPAGDDLRHLRTCGPPVSHS
jgi:hypothetical protein